MSRCVIPRMRRFQALRRLENAEYGVFHRQRALCLHDFRKIAPIHEFQHQEMHVLGLPGIERRHDIGMRELGHRLHFTLETADVFGIARGRGGQHLQRHHALQPPLLGLEHQTHAPLPELTQQHVVVEDQRLALPLPQQLRLELRQLIPPHEFAGQLRSVLRRRRSGKHIPPGKPQPASRPGEGTVRRDLQV